MPLSSASEIQSKTGSAATATVGVALDAGTQAGSTVIVEICGGGASLMDAGLLTSVPAGFEYDGCSIATSLRYLYVFRKPNVAAGEGVAGSTDWDFTFIAATTWHWHVSEWDQDLEPVYPLDAIASSSAVGSGVTTLATGTTLTNGRADTVALAWHMWQRANAPAVTLTFSGLTNGFTQRDALRVTQGSTDNSSCWSWAFNTAVGAFSTTATVNNSSPNAGDTYAALIVVYAATTYA